MVSKSWFWHIFTTAVLRRMRLGDQNDTNWVTGWYRLEYLWVLPIYLQKQGSIIHERCERHPKRYTNEKGSEALSATNGLCGLRGYRFWGVPNRLCSFREPVHPTTYTPFGNGRFARFTECIPARNVLQLVCPWGTCERVVVERWKKQRSPCDWKFGLTLADLKHRVLEHLAWLTPESKQHFKMMKDISHKFPSLCISVPGVSESSKRSLPLFKLSMPFAIQIVCTDHWSARNCWWTPEHGAGHHSVTCSLANQDPFRMIQGDWSLGVLLVRTLADTRRHSSNLAISWCSCLSLQIRWNTGHSCIAFRKGVTMLQPQCSYLRWTYQSPNNEATASSHRNGKTQPTQRLGCTKGDLTLSFPCAIPLWSSTEQWNCELVSQESQQHRNPSLITGKQMIRCRFQVALGGWSSFSKPWHWNALNLVPFSQSLPGDQQSCARKPEQNQLPSATYRTIFN